MNLGTGSARRSTVGPTMDDKRKSKARMSCTDHSSHPDDDLTPPKSKFLYGITLEVKALPRVGAWVENPTPDLAPSCRDLLYLQVSLQLPDG
ncbi:hypothetical protein N7530_006169 [Penicillium desertorum]|uniref:Uncharacterized protein n=1 Tax=Penicillium desertorum TaxID=1303715 RepID=A0A9W9WI29_9EURO|nr:hypothetical protein N7530_010696 [Penicillium desertorum]KAJ5472168.1 hypothetical protein N7530_006169 [Penicillium desertorum]